MTLDMSFRRENKCYEKRYPVLFAVWIRMWSVH